MNPDLSTFIISAFNVIKDIVIVATPFLVAYFTYKNNKKEKEDKKYRALREQVDEEHKLQAEQKEDKLNNQLETITKEMGELRGQIEEVSKAVNVEAINDQLNKLIGIQSMNFNFSQSLSSVIMKIGESIEDSNISSKKEIHDSIAAHQELERKISANLLKIVY